MSQTDRSGSICRLDDGFPPTHLALSMNVEAGMTRPLFGYSPVSHTSTQEASLFPGSLVRSGTQLLIITNPTHTPASRGRLSHHLPSILPS